MRQPGRERGRPGQAVTDDRPGRRTGSHHPRGGAVTTTDKRTPTTGCGRRRRREQRSGRRHPRGAAGWDGRRLPQLRGHGRGRREDCGNKARSVGAQPGRPRGTGRHRWRDARNGKSSCRGWLQGVIRAGARRRISGPAALTWLMAAGIGDPGMGSHEAIHPRTTVLRPYRAGPRQPGRSPMADQTSEQAPPPQGTKRAGTGHAAAAEQPGRGWFRGSGGCVWWPCGGSAGRWRGRQRRRWPRGSSWAGGRRRGNGCR